MKKIFIFTLAMILFSQNVSAETFIVVDQNGNVLQKTTTVDNYITKQITETYSSVPVVNTTIVRETPVYNETYNYSNISTGNAIIAGITTGIIGGLIYNGIKHNHHDKKIYIAPKPHNSHHHKH